MSDKKKDSRPDFVRTFDFFGADMKPPGSGSANWCGDCVFCGKERHFYADPKEGMWDCKVCGEYGNPINFLAKIHAGYKDNATTADWEKLSADRAIPVKYLQRRELVWTDDKWLIPIFSNRGTIRDLRVYDFKQVISTAGCNVQLFGWRELAKAKPGAKIWHCEGEWDGIAMDWLLDANGRRDDVVVAVPGAGSFKDEWLAHYAGKNIVALYDLDLAGQKGAAKCHEKLKKTAKQLTFVNWPLDKKVGYDTRDFVTEWLPDGKPAEVMAALATMVERAPRGVIEQEKADGVVAPEDLEPIELEEVLATFGKHLLMTPDTALMLKLCFSVVFSNDMTGDPVWLYLVAPPSSGKTTILVPFSGSHRCNFQSTLGAHTLVSGWAGKDPSLIPRIVGQTLVVKDFTEILNLPPIVRDDLFGQLRGAFDGLVQKSFGNGEYREYKDCHFSMLAAVTDAIHGYNTAALGERFLKFQVPPLKTNDQDAMIRSAIGSVNCELQRQRELGDVVSRFIARKMETPPTFPERYHARLVALVRSIAKLRTQVERNWRTDEMSYRPVAEGGTRLAKQIVKLGICYAFTCGKTEIDDEVFEVMERVAVDTAYGFGYDIVAAVAKSNVPMTAADLAVATRMPSTTMRRRVEDLVALNVLVSAKGEQSTDSRGQPTGRPPTVYSLHSAFAEQWNKSKKEKPWTIKLKLSARTPSSGSGPRKIVLRRSKTA